MAHCHHHHHLHCHHHRIRIFSFNYYFSRIEIVPICNENVIGWHLVFSACEILYSIRPMFNWKLQKPFKLLKIVKIQHRTYWPITKQEKFYWFLIFFLVFFSFYFWFRIYSFTFHPALKIIDFSYINLNKHTQQANRANNNETYINFPAFSFASSGRDFDPRTRAFSDEELKPQPMIKKSRKQFVPDELKDDKYWARRRNNNIAAKRSRDARRQKENQIAMRARYLEKEVNWL